jgi:hypothetical protein
MYVTSIGAHKNVLLVQKGSAASACVIFHGDT